MYPYEMDSDPWMKNGKNSRKIHVIKNKQSVAHFPERLGERDSHTLYQSRYDLKQFQ